MFSCRQGICIFVRGAIIHFDSFILRIFSLPWIQHPELCASLSFCNVFSLDLMCCACVYGS
jgi:hypothetical protein